MLTTLINAIRQDPLATPLHLRGEDQVGEAPLRQPEGLQADLRTSEEESDVAACGQVLESLLCAADRVLGAAPGKSRNLTGVAAGLDDTLQSATVSFVVGGVARVHAHRQRQVR